MAKSASTDELILEALERALADPSPRKMHGAKANPGIFLSSSMAAKAAAQSCLERGLLEPRGEQKARSKTVLLYGISPAGVAHLLARDPAHQTLAATLQGVERLARAAEDWRQTLVDVQAQVARLRDVVQQAAARVQPPDASAMLANLHASRPQPHPPSQESPALKAPSDDAQREVLRFVRQQKQQAPLRPLDLSQLFRLIQSRGLGLTVGEFHDLLRRMASARQIRLSPFTQAMYQLPEPEYAMIVGREVMYYAESV